MNEVKFKFEGLIIWNKSMDLGEDINRIAEEFPSKELYSLSSQIRRACDSIALNIAEGSILQSKQEFKRFLGYSIRSLAEVVTCIHKAKLRSYISEEDFQKMYFDSFNLIIMMIAFRRKV
jgi:four helix bundle protein